MFFSVILGTGVRSGMSGGSATFPIDMLLCSFGCGDGCLAGLNLEGLRFG